MITNRIIQGNRFEDILFEKTNFEFEVFHLMLGSIPIYSKRAWALVVSKGLWLYQDKKYKQKEEVGCQQNI